MKIVKEAHLPTYVPYFIWKVEFYPDLKLRVDIRICEKVQCIHRALTQWTV